MTRTVVSISMPCDLSAIFGGMLHEECQTDDDYTHIGGAAHLEVDIPHGECFLALALNCNPWNIVPLTVVL